jgi:xanthine dehydrogenase YagR molybdenum-binding subunit
MISVGAPVNRIDGLVKVTGRAKYAADNIFPSMLHAVLVRSTVAAGRVRAIETKSAISVPGAVAIYTHENARKELFGRVLPDLNRFGLGGWFPMTGPDIHFAGQASRSSWGRARSRRAKRRRPCALNMKPGKSPLI